VGLLSSGCQGASCCRLLPLLLPPRLQLQHRSVAAWRPLMLALLLPKLLVLLLVRPPPPPLLVLVGLQAPRQSERCWALHPLLPLLLLWLLLLQVCWALYPLLLLLLVCCNLLQQPATALQYRAVGFPALLQGLRLHPASELVLVLRGQRPHCWLAAPLRPEQQLPQLLHHCQCGQQRLLQHEKRALTWAAPVLKHRTRPAKPAQLQLQALLPQQGPLRRPRRPQQQQLLPLPPQVLLQLRPLLLLPQLRPLPLMVWRKTPLQPPMSPQHHQSLRPQLLLLLLLGPQAQRWPHPALLGCLPPLAPLPQQVTVC
jgi:hypothetical protein